MKKSLLSVGAASLVLAMFATGCATTSTPASLAEEVKKAEAVVVKSRGLENHKKQPGKYVLPNAVLAASKVAYIGWASAAADSILVRFGEADVISVARDATDAANLKLWDAIRNADADKAAAAEAIVEMKKFVATSYAKNKTTSKLSNDAMYNEIVGRMAQEDYITYKKALKAGAKEAEYKDQKTWLAAGKANAKKVAAEHKARLNAAKKRLAKAEKEADEAYKKVNYTVQYYGSKIAFLIAAHQAKTAANPFAKKGFEAAAVAAKASMNDAVKKFPQVTTLLRMPPVRLGSVQQINATKAAWEKELAPWGYAAKIALKRIDSYVEVKKWANEAQKTLDEVSGN